jgi:hypothetical protein
MEDKSIKTTAGIFIYRQKRKHHQMAQDYKSGDLIKYSPDAKKQKYDSKKEKENWEAAFKERENRENKENKTGVIISQPKDILKNDKGIVSVKRPIEPRLDIINETEFESKVTIKNRKHCNNT